MSRLRHLGWNQCSYGLTSRPLESCHHQCLEAVCEVFGLSQRVSFGASGWHAGAPTLYYHFTKRFPPWSLPRVGNWGGKRQSITPGHLLGESGQVGKRVRLTRKTRPGVSSHIILDPEHPTPRRWKRSRPLPPKEWEVRWASLAIFFLALGWLRFAPGTPGTCHRREQA